MIPSLCVGVIAGFFAAFHDLIPQAWSLFPDLCRHMARPCPVATCICDFMAGALINCR